MIARGKATQRTDKDEREGKKVEVKKAYKFGGGKVLFTKKEKKELMDLRPPGLRVIAFKPQDMLPKWAAVIGRRSRRESWRDSLLLRRSRRLRGVKVLRLETRIKFVILLRRLWRRLWRRIDDH